MSNSRQRTDAFVGLPEIPFTLILRYVGSLPLAIHLESIWLGLPHRIPNPCLSSPTDVFPPDLRGQRHFPASWELVHSPPIWHAWVGSKVPRINCNKKIWILSSHYRGDHTKAPGTDTTHPTPSFSTHPVPVLPYTVSLADIPHLTALWLQRFVPDFADPWLPFKPSSDDPFDRFRLPYLLDEEKTKPFHLRGDGCHTLLNLCFGNGRRRQKLAELVLRNRPCTEWALRPEEMSFVFGANTALMAAYLGRCLEAEGRKVPWKRDWVAMAGGEEGGSSATPKWYPTHTITAIRAGKMDVLELLLAADNAADVEEREASRLGAVMSSEAESASSLPKFSLIKPRPRFLEHFVLRRGLEAIALSMAIGKPLSDELSRMVMFCVKRTLDRVNRDTFTNHGLMVPPWKILNETLLEVVDCGVVEAADALLARLDPAGVAAAASQAVTTPTSAPRFWTTPAPIDPNGRFGDFDLAPYTPPGAPDRVCRGIDRINAEHALWTAASAGQPHMLAYLWSLPTLRAVIEERVARGGDTALWMLVAAASSGDVVTMAWMVDVGPARGCVDLADGLLGGAAVGMVLEKAAASRRAEAVRWVVERFGRNGVGFPVDAESLKAAAEALRPADRAPTALDELLDNPWTTAIEISDTDIKEILDKVVRKLGSAGLRYIERLEAWVGHGPGFGFEESIAKHIFQGALSGEDAELVKWVIDRHRPEVVFMPLMPEEVQRLAMDTWMALGRMGRPDLCQELLRRLVIWNDEEAKVYPPPPYIYLTVTAIHQCCYIGAELHQLKEQRHYLRSYKASNTIAADDAFIARLETLFDGLLAAMEVCLEEGPAIRGHKVNMCDLMYCKQRGVFENTKLWSRYGPPVWCGDEGNEPFPRARTVMACLETVPDQVEFVPQPYRERILSVLEKCRPKQRGMKLEWAALKS
ncbi:hypothetical protein HDU96_004192 [Phlyctochytrium bullatum]|nr:hypothetical protein HDU96_004192 [Phlyctochytrium bullatum]